MKYLPFGVWCFWRSGQNTPHFAIRDELDAQATLYVLFSDWKIVGNEVVIICLHIERGFCWQTKPSNAGSTMFVLVLVGTVNQCLLDFLSAELGLVIDR